MEGSLINLITDKMREIGPNGKIAGIGIDTIELLESLHDEFPGWSYVCMCLSDSNDVRSKFIKLDNVDIRNMYPTEEFDVLLIDVLERNLEWHLFYGSVSRMLAKDGMMVSFNVSHATHGEYIRQAISNLHFMEICDLGSVIISKEREIRYGSYDISLDIGDYDSNASELLKSDKVKVTGATGFNRFTPVPGDKKKTLSSFMNETLCSRFEWNFEYFLSGEPAGLHTDYISIPNSWKPKKDNVTTHDVHIVIGVIIPLDWNCGKTPFTVNYDKVSRIPRKLLYRKGEMRYADNDEIFSYRPASEDDWEYDPEVLVYNPIDTQYHREYANLKVHSVYEWRLGTMLVFDTSRWHSSSWFLSTKSLPSTSVEYKKSIIGFGSIDVDRWV